MSFLTDLARQLPVDILPYSCDGSSQIKQRLSRLNDNNISICESIYRIQFIASKALAECGGVSNHILSRISELHRSIDSLRNQCTNDPDRIEKALTGALEELMALQQELQVREQHEITKAEQAEETLWQSKERFRVLTRNLTPVSC